MVFLCCAECTTEELEVERRGGLARVVGPRTAPASLVKGGGKVLRAGMAENVREVRPLGVGLGLAHVLHDCARARLSAEQDVLVTARQPPV